MVLNYVNGCYPSCPIAFGKSRLKCRDGVRFLPKFIVILRREIRKINLLTLIPGYFLHMLGEKVSIPSSFLDIID